MNLLKFKSRKSLVLYIIMGIVHFKLITSGVRIPISSFLPVPGTWNSDIFTVITVILIVLFSLLEKKNRKENYIWILLTALLVTFITSYGVAIVLLFSTPFLDFA